MDRSDSQPFATFGASCVDNRTSTAGFHANQKAMGTCTACFRGLVSTFHGLSFRFKISGSKVNRALSLFFTRPR